MIEREDIMPRLIISLLTLLFSLAFLSSCNDSWATNDSSSSSEHNVNDDDDDDDVAPSTWRELSEAERKLLEADNLFGINLFKEIVAAEPDANIFISPLSVSMALGMAYNGAGGATATQMQDTLGLSELTIDEINQAYKDLITLFMGLDEQVAFNIANSVWYSSDLNPVAEFMQNMITYFDAEVAGLNFSDSASVDTINDWVKDKTEEKIEEVIDSLDPSTVAVLANAIYFKGDWTIQFDPDDTIDDQFTTAAGNQVPCRMMYIDTDLAYARTEQYQAVDLKYGVGDYSMTLFLPAADVDIDDLIAGIDQQSYAEMTTGFIETEVTLQMPSFELEYVKSLGDILQLMGMTDAFDAGAADFSNLFEEVDSYISEVLHKTYVKVDEVGTEAAAVTAVVIETLSANDNYMILDRPFIFVIRENNSGTIMFIGKIVDPS